MNKIGIIVSSHLEAKIFGVTMGSSPIRSFDHYVIACCGRGQEGVDKAILHLTYQGIDGLISWGFAGGIVPSLRTGTLVVPKQLIHPFGPTLDCNLDWHQLVKECLDKDLPVSTGHIMHSDNVLASNAQKQAGALRTHCVAVDQESFYIAQWAHRLKIPMIAIRVILDDIFTELPNKIESFQKENGELNYQTLLKTTLSPSQWPALWRLKNQYQLSQKHLKIVAERAIVDRPFH